MFKSYSMELGGRTLTLEFGKYAEQAAGSTFVRYGDTAVLVNATVSETPRPGIDFFPLSVDYEEKLYSVGHIPGSWNRREGRPGEKAILTSRLIDRPLRPLFPKGMRNDVSVVATVMSVDFDCSPETPAMIGASAALCVSEIPFAGPVGAVNIGLVDDEFVVNPTLEQREKSSMNLTVAGTKEAVLMVEAGANEVSEEVMLKAILFAHEQVKKIVEFQEQIVSEIGKEKREFHLELPGDDVKAAVREYAYDKVQWMFETFDRGERNAREAEVKKDVAEHFQTQFEGRETEVGDALYAIEKEVMRRHIIDNGVRPDGRKLTEVRPIWCETGVLPRPHGSGVFTRGQTQVMTVCTLAPMSEVQILDGITPETTKRYMHHYNFPGYSTGEAKATRSPGRREIGHGALAGRALEAVLPSVEEFPYAIRLVSEVVSSNGSTSQASVCGSTLALMDAGVPITAPVAGISCGLITDDDGSWATMIDIQGLEDFFGDMDFKVAGTKKGITAIQMDLKIDGLTPEIIRNALETTRKGRLYIIDDIILPCIPEPRSDVSKYAPKMISTKIEPDKIREVIGTGGKVIQKICADTGAQIDIEDDGSVFIAAVDKRAAYKALDIINAIVSDPEPGAIYTGKVTGIIPIGCFVEYAPGKEGLVHISKLDTKRVEKVEDVVHIGDEIKVMVLGVDNKGRINLSRRDALEVYDEEN